MNVDIKKIKNLIEPLVIQNNLELYYVEFVKEHNKYYLRVYIDNDNGISLNDCEKISRLVSAKLDEADPIDVSYYLEVSSPGINRTLYTDSHLKKYIGCNVEVNMKNDQKTLLGILKDFNENEIIIQNEENAVPIKRSDISCVKLRGDM